MKFIITFILSLLVVSIIPREEYRVKAEFSEVTKVEVVESTDVQSSTSAPSSPVTSEKISATPATAEIPNDQERAIIESYPYRHVIAQIYKGESTFGKYDVCRKRGLANGFGYAEPNPLVNGPTCFNSFEEVVGHVNSWIDKRAQEGFYLSEMNCYYVRGIRATECDTSYKLN